VGASLGELRGLRCHCLRAILWWSGAKNIGVRSVSLDGGGMAVGPIIPAALAPQVRHVHEKKGSDERPRVESLRGGGEDSAEMQKAKKKSRGGGYRRWS
jgi:hypothetical protein